MFLRLVVKSIIYRRGRAGVAVLALLVGAGMASAMLSVYYDANQKMTRELRAYGANIMVTAKEQGDQIDQAVLAGIRTSHSSSEIVAAAPYLYLVANARVASPKARPATLVLAGADFEQIKKVSPWWQVEGSWVDASDDRGCMIGVNAAHELGVALDQQIRIENRDIEAADTLSAANIFRVRGIVTTGSEEDDQIFAPLNAVQNLAATPDKISAVAVSVVGTVDQVEALALAIANQYEGVEAKPIRQIAQNEGAILAKLKLMMILVTVLVLAGAVLSVATTLAELVIERRLEIGTMKALGAHESRLFSLFLTELAGLGLLGGILGYGIGLVLAQFIGHSLFNKPVSPRITVLLLVILLSISTALLSGLIPIRRMREIKPAVILKGD